MEILFYGLAMIVLLLLSVPIHELGHYFAIKVFGGNINFVELTSGKPILKWRYFSIGLKLYTGQVNWNQDSILSNKKKALVSLAGPLMDFLLFALTFTTGITLYGLGFISPSSLMFFASLSGLYFLSGFLDMIPNKKTKNDGYTFVSRFFSSK